MFAVILSIVDNLKITINYFDVSLHFTLHYHMATDQVGPEHCLYNSNRNDELTGGTK